MKFGILGAGAMGCLFGGHLAEAGHEVVLVDIWKDHIDAINQRGLIITGISGDRTITNIKGKTNPEDAGICDVVIVFVKSTHTLTAIEGAISMIGTDTAVITLQNGVGNVDSMAQVVNPAQILAGVTSHGAALTGPGDVKHAGKGDSKLGELSGEITDRAKTIAEALTMAGLKTETTDNVIGIIWSKLLINVGINALTAILGVTNGRLVEIKPSEEILEDAVKEALMVTKTKGIKILYDDAISHTKNVCRLTSQNKSSMLQDVINGRQTEIDFINGAIVKEGKALGIQTPTNELLYKLIKAIELRGK